MYFFDRKWCHPKFYSLFKAERRRPKSDRAKRLLIFFAMLAKLAFSADDKDCTPWAPTCSPLGYCRGSPEEWDWDGSFGSPTNPKPDGEQSDWIKQNAASGGARNEDYYKKIEDDNRAAHVKFTSSLKQACQLALLRDAQVRAALLRAAPQAAARSSPAHSSNNAATPT